MPATDPRVKISDNDADAATADVRTTDPAGDTAGVVVRIAGTLPTPALSSGAATGTKQDAQTALLTTIDASLTALPPASSAVVNGTQTATASAVALPSHTGRLITVVADDANTVTVYVGGSALTAANGIPLAAGDSHNYARTNSNLIYIICASGSPVVRYEVQ